MARDTEGFLRAMNEMNEAIAAREAEAAAKKPEPDLVRLQKDAERREKWGQLRAREHPTRRVKRTHSILPHVDLS